MEGLITFFSSAWAWLFSAEGAKLLGALFVISEILGELEFFKKSSIFGYVKAAIAWVKSKVSPAA